MYYHWLGDWQPYADETDGITYFWLGEEAEEYGMPPVLVNVAMRSLIAQASAAWTPLGEEADRPNPPKPFDPDPEDDGFITVYPKL